jgi:HTH-type transcriptional regulator/antitoxin HigA
MALCHKELEQVMEAGKVLAPVLRLPTDANAYNQTVELMDYLLDTVGDDESHPLMPLIHALGNLIEEYEAKHVPDLGSTPVERLKYLMEEHGLTQTDLAKDFGSQSIVSEVLNGKRELNKKHIIALSQRFQVSPDIFF